MREGHAPGDDVEQLGELVQGVLAERRADTGDPGVVVQLEQWAGAFVLGLESGEAGLGVHDHRTELHHREFPAVEAYARLPEECGTAVGADGEGKRDQNGGQQDEEQQRRQHVQHGLHETG